ncbi:MAG: LysM peptidoglycan-binding domain-containing protein [Parasporobacterium sp.]|nr:LysM peptidoglycan-binding domain-containing protein [Parasporobacterium sp.]
MEKTGVRYNRKRELLRKRIIRICLLLSFAAAVIAVLVSSGNETMADEDNAVKMYTSVSIEPGDSLWSIAVEYIDCHYSTVDEFIAELKQINNLSSDTINADAYLLVPYYVS